MSPRCPPMEQKGAVMTAQQFEKSWWGDCCNTYGEETKQIVYAKLMGLTSVNIDGKGPFFDTRYRSVVDLGGGPTSMLLKAINTPRRLVVDPCAYPMWTRARYDAAGIHVWVKRAEDFEPQDRFDECWMYNVLQHTDDPELIIQRARMGARIIRIVEWVDIPPHEGHPHELKAALLDQWLRGTGKVKQMMEGGCYGRVYYGTFGGL